MIVMKSSATEEEVQSVIDRIEEVGARAHPSRGEEVTVIGAIGDREHVMRLGLEGAPGVEQVVPILKPYKLALGAGPSRAERGRDRRPPHRRRALLDDRRAVHGRVARPDARHRAHGQGGRRLAVPRRRLQAAHLALRVPGPGQEGLQLLAEASRDRAADRHRGAWTRATSSRCSRYADVLQIGARNMQNFPLLRAVGQPGARAAQARARRRRIEECCWRPSTSSRTGNPDVMLCERGIRTFETRDAATRST